MKLKNRLVVLNLLVAPFCCLGAANKPVRNFTMVDMQNGLTPTLLSVGPTSFTFSVEWTPDVKFPEEQLYLMSKPDAETPWWSVIAVLYLNPANKVGIYVDDCFPVEGGIAHGKATFEVLDQYIPSLYREESNFAEKAFFSVEIPDPNYTGLEELEKELRAMTPEELREYDKRLEESLKAPMPAAEATASPTSRMENQDDGQSEGQKKTNRLWLYLGILLGVFCIAFYCVRKKLATRN